MGLRSKWLVIMVLVFVGLATAGISMAAEIRIGIMQARAKAKYPKLKLLEPQFSGASSDKAAQLSADLMTAHPDLKGLIAVASSTCPGVGQAIEGLEAGQYVQHVDRLVQGLLRGTTKLLG